jgi:hypothetical protein
VKVTVFWDVVSCGPEKTDASGVFQGDRLNDGGKKNISETSVNFYQVTQHIPEESFSHLP